MNVTVTGPKNTAQACLQEIQSLINDVPPPYEYGGELAGHGRAAVRLCISEPAALSHSLLAISRVSTTTVSDENKTSALTKTPALFWLN